MKNTNKKPTKKPVEVKLIETITRKPVKLKLVGLNGNAWVLMGSWRAQAIKEGWTPEEIKIVLDEAKTSDYNNLLYVLGTHCKNWGA